MENVFELLVTSDELTYLIEYLGKGEFTNAWELIRPEYYPIAEEGKIVLVGIFYNDDLRDNNVIKRIGEIELVAFENLEIGYEVWNPTQDIYPEFEVIFEPKMKEVVIALLDRLIDNWKRIKQASLRRN